MCLCVKGGLHKDLSHSQTEPCGVALVPLRGMCLEFSTQADC